MTQRVCCSVDPLLFAHVSESRNQSECHTVIIYEQDGASPLAIAATAPIKLQINAVKSCCYYLLCNHFAFSEVPPMV